MAKASQDAGGGAADAPMSGGGDAPLLTIDAEVFAKVDVNLTAVLGRGRTTVGELVALKAGDEITLDTPLDGRVDLLVNDRLVARGEIVAVGDRFGVRITDVAVR